MFTIEEMNDKLNKIHCMDCLDFMQEVPDNYFDLVLTDPPYGTTKNEWDNVVNLDLWWSEIKRITKENTAVISFSAQPFTTDLINSNRTDFRYSLVWDKVLPVGFLNANRMPLRSHEDICVFYKKLPFYNPEKSQGHERKIVTNRSCKQSTNYGDFKDGGSYDSTERFPKSILEFSSGGTRTQIVHPTQKPLELVGYLLRLYSNKDFKVFDSFMGSGTTAVACQSLGIDWCGCELDEEYCKIARDRLSKVQLSLF